MELYKTENMKQTVTGNEIQLKLTIQIHKRATRLNMKIACTESTTTCSIGWIDKVAIYPTQVYLNIEFEFMYSAGNKAVANRPRVLYGNFLCFVANIEQVSDSVAVSVASGVYIYITIHDYSILKK